MIKFVGYDIVFQEIPDEVTLAINLSLCPNRCEGCHSPYLREDMGNELTTGELDKMIEPYRGEVTCICFMGGDGDPAEVARLAEHVHEKYKGTFLTAWYSGRPQYPDGFRRSAFDFVKLGPYIPDRGPLNKKTTNQRLYHLLPDGRDEDITSRFWRK